MPADACECQLAGAATSIPTLCALPFRVAPIVENNGQSGAMFRVGPIQAINKV